MKALPNAWEPVSQAVLNTSITATGTRPTWNDGSASLMAVENPARDESVETAARRRASTGAIEHGIYSEECNRADWRGTLRYAAAAKRRWQRDIVRLPTLRKWSAQRLVQQPNVNVSKILPYVQIEKIGAEF
jgi:hypothetical protein